MIRMATDQLGGITYTYRNVDAVLANTPSSIQYFGDLSEPSPFNNGASGPKHTVQDYFVAFAQDEWRVRAELHAQLRPALRLLHAAARSRQPHRQVQHRHRPIDPNTTPLLPAKKNNFQPRVSATCSLTSKTVLKGGVRHLRRPGPDRRPDSAGRSRAHQHDGQSRRVPRLSGDDAIARQLHQQPEQPLVPAACLRERLHAAGEGLPSTPRRFSRNSAATGGDGRVRRQPGTQPVPAQHRQPDHRRAVQRRRRRHAVREFDIVTCANGTGAHRHRCARLVDRQHPAPYAEIDYKTSGGHDSYNSMQLALTRRRRTG